LDKPGVLSHTIPAPVPGHGEAWSLTSRGSQPARNDTRQPRSRGRTPIAALNQSPSRTGREACTCRARARRGRATDQHAEHARASQHVRNMCCRHVSVATQPASAVNARPCGTHAPDWRAFLPLPVPAPLPPRAPPPLVERALGCLSEQPTAQPREHEASPQPRPSSDSQGSDFGRGDQLRVFPPTVNNQPN